jgi:hypothetical protein
MVEEILGLQTLPNDQYVSRAIFNTIDCHMSLVAMYRHQVMQIAWLEQLVLDRLPCSTAVVGANRFHEFSCNLAKLTDAQKDHPTVLLAETILGAGMTVPLVGLTDGE